VTSQIKGRWKELTERGGVMLYQMTKYKKFEEFSVRDDISQMCPGRKV